MESSKLPIRIYTNYRASLGIAKQTSLATISTKHSNLQLVHASEYIQRFNIELHHKEGKPNTIPNALSQLLSSSHIVKDLELDFTPKDIAFVDLAFANFSNLPIVYNYIVTLVEMLDNFKQRLLKGY